MDIYFDENHDMVLDGNDIRFTKSDEDVKQRLTIRLQFLLEEWFLNTSSGLPYTQVFFEQGTSIEDIYIYFRDEIKNTEGVEKINRLELTPNTRNKSLLVETTVNDNIQVEVSI